MTQSAVLGFIGVSLAVIVVPGPSVLFAVSRAIVAGRRSALLTVLGNASGLFVQVIVIALGLGALVAASDLTQALLRVVGAAYLVWLGVEAIRHRHEAAQALEAPVQPAARPWRDGLIVGITNAKSAVLLAALLPRHVAPGASSVEGQMLALGTLFCLMAIVSDGLWAVLADRVRRPLAADPRRLAWASVAGGLILVGLGLLLFVD